MAGARAHLTASIRELVLAHYEAFPITTPSHPNFGANVRSLCDAWTTTSTQILPTTDEVPQRSTLACTVEITDGTCVVSPEKPAGDTIDLIDSPEPEPPAMQSHRIPLPLVPLKRPFVAHESACLDDDDDDDNDGNGDGNHINPECSIVDDVMTILDSPAPVHKKRRLPVAEDSPPAMSSTRFRASLPMSSQGSSPAKSRLEGRSPGRSPSKRGATTRLKPSKQLLLRLKRAFEHPVLLVDRPDGGRMFHVMGATGKTYQVSIERTPSCTCLDFVKRKAGESSSAPGPCKHILFVMHRVLKVDQYDTKLFQVCLLDEELEEIFQNSPTVVGGDVMADEIVCTKFKESQQSQTEDNESEGTGAETDCPICFVALGQDLDALVACETCRKKLHGECMQKVLQYANANQRKCPMCRSVWQAQAVGGALINLAEFSSQHKHTLSMARLYPDSHQHIARRRRGRGRGQSRGRGRSRGRSLDVE